MTPARISRKITHLTIHCDTDAMKQEAQLPRTLSELHRATANIRRLLEDRVTKTDLTRTQKLVFKNAKLARHLKPSEPAKNISDPVSEYQLCTKKKGHNRFFERSPESHCAQNAIDTNT